MAEANVSNTPESIEEPLTLASGFDQPSEDAWMQLVDKVLKGAPFKKLQSTTPGGIQIEPLYTKDVVDSLGAPNAPGEYPYTRGGSATPRDDVAWDVRSTVAVGHPQLAQRTIVRELERGSTQITLRFDQATRHGYGQGHDDLGDSIGRDGVAIPSATQLGQVLDGVYVDLVDIYLDAESGASEAWELLSSIERDGFDASTLSGGLVGEPIALLATRGELAGGIDAAITERINLSLQITNVAPQFRALGISSEDYANAGATETQEIAIVLATAAEYLRRYATAGTTLEQALSHIELTLTTDADVFTSIAKLRAARQLWANLVVACGGTEAQAVPRLHVALSKRMLTKRDPWVNMLRVTAATFAGGVGGADGVDSQPFDERLGEPGELGRRIARNTQLLLQEESNVGVVADPAGGSWYVESLTQEIAATAWEEFQAIEAAGGIVASLQAGTLQGSIVDAAAAQLARVAHRKDPITGVSEFPDIHEAPVERDVTDLDMPVDELIGDTPQRVSPSGDATIVEALTPVFWAQEFEALRDQSDAYLQANGARPQVFLVNIGPVASHTARATFAKNFFEAGGIEAVTSTVGSTTGFNTIDEVQKAITDAAPALVCLCSSDSLYGEHGVAFTQAIAASSNAAIYLAGRLPDLEADLQAAGVSEFIAVGADVLSILRDAHHVVGSGATPSAPVTSEEQS